MKNYIIAMTFIFMAFFSPYSMATGVTQEEANTLARAFFFAIEHDNYDGAVSLLEENARGSVGGSDGLKKVATENAKVLRNHVSINFAETEVLQDKAYVRIFLVDEKMHVWGVEFAMQMDGELLKIVACRLIKTGEDSV